MCVGERDSERRTLEPEKLAKDTLKRETCKERAREGRERWGGGEEDQLLFELNFLSSSLPSLTKQQLRKKNSPSRHCRRCVPRTFLPCLWLLE